MNDGQPRFYPPSEKACGHLTPENILLHVLRVLFLDVFLVSVGMAEGSHDQLHCSLEDRGDIGEHYRVCKYMVEWLARGVQKRVVAVWLPSATNCWRRRAWINVIRGKACSSTTNIFVYHI